MRFIEIDGERYNVPSCYDCPCVDSGDDGWGACCNHPKVTRYNSAVDYYGNGVEDWCPLREVEEC